MLAQKLRDTLQFSADERVPVALLFAEAFCLGLARLMFQTAGSALLLLSFGAAGLPYVYLVAGLTVPLLGLAYAWLEARLGLRALLIVNVGGLLLGALLLFGGALLLNSPWPSFGVAVFYEVVWAMTGLALWPLAGRLFNVRQGKRLFGFINAGDVVAAVLGGLALPFLVGAFGMRSLLLIAAVSFAAALGLIVVITGRFRDRLTLAPEASAREAAATPRPAPRGYVPVIVALAALSFASFYFIDNIFYTLVDQAFTSEAALADFLGPFWAGVYGLTLLSNLFLVGPIISRFGLRVGLLLLPVLTFAVTGAMLVGGLLSMAAALLFALASVNNLFDWVVRETVYKSGLIVLYQPLPPRTRMWAQTMVETIGQPLAQGAVGLALVGMSVLAFGVMQLTAVLFAMLAIVLALTWIVSNRYVGALKNALTQRRFGNSAFTPPERASLALLRQSLRSPYPGALVYALDTLEEMGHPALTEGLQLALSHAAVEVRREAAARIERLSLATLAGAVRAQLEMETDPPTRGALVRVLAALSGADAALTALLDDEHEPVRVGALVGLLKHGQLDSVLVAGARLHQLLDSGLASDRLAAAHVIGEVHAPSLQQPLVRLLRDETVEVRRAALEAAGHMAQPVLLAMALSAMEEPATRAAASRALALAGEAALPGLAAALDSDAQPREVTARLIAVVSRRPGAAATAILTDQLKSADGDRRHHALHALTQRRYRAGEGERPALEQAVLTEVGEAARLLTALGDVAPRLRDIPAGHPFRLDPALLEAVGRRRDRVFMLLALLFDAEAAMRVRDNLWNGTPERHAYALEVLEALLPQRLRAPVLALMESVAPAERQTKLSALFAPVRASPDQRLYEIVTSSAGLYSPWVRTCALYTLTQTPDLDAAALARLPHSGANPLLREMALWALAQAEPRLYRAQYHAVHGGHMLSLIEKVIILKSVSIFAETPPSVLAEVARLLEEVELAGGQCLFTKGEPGRSLYLIVQGRVRVHDGDHTVNTLGPRTIVGEMAVLDLEPRLASVTALEDTLLLRLDQEALYELMSDRVEVARGIIRVLSSRLRNTVQELTQARQERVEA